MVSNKEEIIETMSNKFHLLDMLLHSLDYQELIDTVIHNEAYHDIPRLDKVFKYLIELRLIEARDNYNKNKDVILKELYKQSPQYHSD